MFRRGLYGLTLACPFDLPELLLGHLSAGTVRVEFGRVAPMTPVIAERGCRFWADGGEAKLQYDGVGTYHVMGGERIVIQPERGSDERELRFLLLGPAMAMLLHQRGLLVLHAGTVRIGGVGAMITGFSGRGKSTLTAALCTRGHPLVSDDVTAITLSEGQRPQSVPGSRQIRLLPESLEALGYDDSSSGHALHRRTDKRGWCAKACDADGPTPIRRLYVLADASEISIEPMPPHRAFGQFVICTYPVVARLLDADGTAKSHFAQCAALASQVTVAKLKRPRALELLPKLAQAIENDVLAAARA